jgi:hypothetical protein
MNYSTQVELVGMILPNWIANSGIGSEYRKKIGGKIWDQLGHSALRRIYKYAVGHIQYARKPLFLKPHHFVEITRLLRDSLCRASDVKGHSGDPRILRSRSKESATASA